ncbi:MAG: GDP-mannose 4,6-dehydratase [Clostridiales bacterium]|nr:GDP-mannose 4,6-dehydratase [Clostridiales bacterium]
MKALVIGGAGFVGNHLVDHLTKDKKWDVAITKLENENIYNKNVETYSLNILNKDEIINVLNKVQPDYIFHLAAQSSVAASWKNPGLTIDINIKGSVNVLDSVREVIPKSNILLIGSGEEYGHILPNETPIIEDNPLRPGNIYAATKAAQNMLGKIYADAYQMNVIMVRAFNHIGPGQAPMFVVSDFCKQTVEIEKGIKEPVIHVGNLSSKREFTDVRDVVKAYSLLIEKGRRGEIYNVGNGHAVEIKEILNLILSMSQKKISVEIDQNRLRPVDVPIIEADIKKLIDATGWKQEIPLETTIKETLDYWRKIL